MIISTGLKKSIEKDYYIGEKEINNWLNLKRKNKKLKLILKRGMNKNNKNKLKKRNYNI